MQHSSGPLSSQGPPNLGPGTGDVDSRTSCCPVHSRCVPTALMPLVKGSEPTHDHHSPGPRGLIGEHMLSFHKCHHPPFSLMLSAPQLALSVALSALF